MDKSTRIKRISECTEICHPICSSNPLVALKRRLSPNSFNSPNVLPLCERSGFVSFFFVSLSSFILFIYSSLLFSFWPLFSVVTVVLSNMYVLADIVVYFAL